MAAARSTRKSVASVAKAAPVSGAARSPETRAGKAVRDPFTVYGHQLASVGQENLEAVVAANAALARGSEQIYKEMFGLTQGAFENLASAAKDFFRATTLQDIVEVNNRFAMTAVENFLANSARLSAMALKVASEAAQPLQARIGAPLEGVGKPAAS